MNSTLIVNSAAAVLLAVTGYFLRDVAAIQKEHGRRINNHAQRLAILDKGLDSSRSIEE